MWPIGFIKNVQKTEIVYCSKTNRHVKKKVLHLKFWEIQKHFFLNFYY